MRFFNRFDAQRETLTHADLLRLNALALAARKDVEALIETVDESTVAVTLPGKRPVFATDWDNVQSVIQGA